MTVADLQVMLEQIGRLLESAGTKSATLAELAGFKSDLEPLKDLTVKAFGTFLKKALAEPKPGPAPRTPKPTGTDKAQAEQAAAKMKDHYAHALDPSVTRELVDETAAKLEPLTIPRLQQLAKEIGISQPIKKKPDLIKAIKHQVIDRKGTFERSTV